MANNLKKIEVGNPLYNLEMWDWLDAYDLAQDDEQLARVLHNLLDEAEKQNRPVLRSAVFSMITFSTGMSINPYMLIPHD